MKKKTLITILALGTILSVATLGVSNVLADDTQYPLIVQRIAEKFNLNEEDVEAVFDAVHDEKHERIQSMKEDRLNQAVADGVITEEQKQALLAKHEEMWKERNEDREQHMQEMEEWFDEQGIDHSALMEYLVGYGSRDGFAMMGGRHFH